MEVLVLMLATNVVERNVMRARSMTDGCKSIPRDERDLMRCRFMYMVRAQSTQFRLDVALKLCCIGASVGSEYLTPVLRDTTSLICLKRC